MSVVPFSSSSSPSPDCLNARCFFRSLSSVRRKAEEPKRCHAKANQRLSVEARVSPSIRRPPLEIKCTSIAYLNLSHRRNRAGGRGLTSSRWQKRWCDFSDGVFRYSSAIGSKPNEIGLEDIVSVSPIVEQERVSLRSVRSAVSSYIGDCLTQVLPPFSDPHSRNFQGCTAIHV